MSPKHWPYIAPQSDREESHRSPPVSRISGPTTVLGKTPRESHKSERQVPTVEGAVSPKPVTSPGPGTLTVTVLT